MPRVPFTAIQSPEPFIPDSFRELSDEAFKRFAEAYNEYGPGEADELGLAAQWADMNRKVKKLKRSFWEGKQGYLTRESEKVILQDLIGHALLSLEMLERGMSGGRDG